MAAPSVNKFAKRMEDFVNKQNLTEVTDPQAAVKAFFTELAAAVQEMVEEGIVINTVTPNSGSPLVISTPMIKFV